MKLNCSETQIRIL